MPLRRGRRLYRPIRNGMLSGDVDIAAAQHVSYQSPLPYNHLTLLFFLLSGNGY